MNIGFNTGDLELFLKILPFIIPLAIIQLTLTIIALVMAVKQKKFRYGNQVLWVLVILLISLIGPVVYFIIGRNEE